MGRIFALDIGDARIGVAASDLLHMLANPVETYKRTGDFEKDVNYIATLAKTKEAEVIVSGFPVRLDGNETIQTQKAREFAEAVKHATGLPLVYVDERLTTVEAERILIEQNVRREDRKKVIDQVAAVIILQNYLDSRQV